MGLFIGRICTLDKMGGKSKIQQRGYSIFRDFWRMAAQNVKVDGIGFEVMMDQGSRGIINGRQFDLNTKEISDRIWHIIRDDRTYEVEVVDDGVLKVNGTPYAIEIADRFEALLKQLGMDRGAASKVAEVKAPMPGLVLKVLTRSGERVSKGDGLLVLEAMKMENVIKSPVDGTIANVHVEQGKTVEKNQVMISFS
jgi:biotin carboxyl carrier protein